MIMDIQKEERIRMMIRVNERIGSLKEAEDLGQ